MTHVPDCDKHPRRATKMVALCGATVSIRKAKTSFPTCPVCADLDSTCMESMFELFQSMKQVIELILDRRAFIAARKALARRRWRR
jgi:hypothetical protein